MKRATESDGKGQECRVDYLTLSPGDDWNHDAFFTLHISQIPFYSYVQSSGPRCGGGLAQTALASLPALHFYSPMSFSSEMQLS